MSSSNAIEIIQQELSEANKLLTEFISSEAALTTIEQAAEVLIEAIKNGNKILSCGNGGSHCDAMHFAEELSGRYRGNRKALPAMAISDASHISCTANDFGYDHVFSRFVEGLGQTGDVLFALSTSGNSSNIIKAAEAASEKGMKVIGLTGKDGGRLAQLCDVEIRVPHIGFADRIQEIHIKVIHILILLVERGLGLA